MGKRCEALKAWSIKMCVSFPFPFLQRRLFKPQNKVITFLKQWIKMTHNSIWARNQLQLKIHFKLNSSVLEFKASKQSQQTVWGDTSFWYYIPTLTSSCIRVKLLLLILFIRGSWGYYSCTEDKSQKYAKAIKWHIAAFKPVQNTGTKNTQVKQIEEREIKSEVSLGSWSLLRMRRINNLMLSSSVMLNSAQLCVGIQNELVSITSYMQV